MPSFSTLTVAAAAVSAAFAQTFTSCNPTNATCDPTVGLASWSYDVDFTASDATTQFSQGWVTAPGTKVNFGPQGAVFNMSSSASAPTIYSNFTFLFGRVDIKMQAAPGTGIISSIVMESADLDEVDILVMGGNTTAVETNTYGKGGNSQMIYVPANPPQTDFHTYTVEWTSSSLVWSIDGSTVRTLAYGDAKGGDSFPQTPLGLKIGAWDGGRPGGQPGTIAWAGGLTDFSKGPFLMYIESISVTNLNPASSYTWTDQTGSFNSIHALNSSSVSTNNAASNDTPTATVTGINGGPTLVTATSSPSAGSGGSGTSSAGASTTSSAKNFAGRTAEVSYTLAVLGITLFMLTR